MIRPEPSRGDIVTYDFRRPSRISPDRQRNLEASHEQFAQLLQRWVSGRLRAPFEVQLETIGQATYGAFVDSLADPGAVFLYDVANMPDQTIAVCLDPSIAFLLVEKLVGGSAVTAAPERALTTLEQMIIRIVTDRVTREVTRVWKEHMALEFTFARFESARELIEMTGRNEDVLVISLRAGFDELQGYIHVALPFPVLESLLGSANHSRGHAPARPTPERMGEQNRVEGLVRRAGVVVAVRLPETRMTLGRLSALKPGDFLTTEASTAEAVEILVSNKLRFRGRQGRLGPHMGVQITDPVPVD